MYATFECVDDSEVDGTFSPIGDSNPSFHGVVPSAATLAVFTNVPSKMPMSDEWRNGNTDVHLC